MNLHTHVPNEPTIRECCTGTGENECFIEPLSSRDANTPAALHDKSHLEDDVAFLLRQKDDSPVIDVVPHPSAFDFDFSQLTDKPPVASWQTKVEKELMKIHDEDIATSRFDMYTLAELRQTKFANDSLLDPFLPRIGIGAVVGMPDSGKSMLCRQLALTIAYGKRKFLGYTLSPKHKRAIFVTTEDTLEATKFCFMRQSDHFKTIIRPEYEKELKVLLADDLTTDEILQRLEMMLQASPADLVVIDAYGDVFKGGEGNSNIANRNSLRPFSILSKNYETCILFVHHTNKSSKFSAPDHTHVQGGSGFVQKVRTVLELRSKKSEGTTKYLACTKGNGVSHEDKKNAIELSFSEKTFLYTPTGSRIPLEELRADKNEPQTKTKIDAKEIFAPHEMTLKRSEIIERAMKRYGVSERNTERWIADSLQQASYGVYKNPHFTLIDASLSFLKSASPPKAL